MKKHKIDQIEFGPIKIWWVSEKKKIGINWLSQKIKDK